MKVSEWGPFAWLMVALLLAVAMSGCATTTNATVTYGGNSTSEGDCVGLSPIRCALKRVDTTCQGEQRDGEWVACAQSASQSLSQSVAALRARNWAVTAKCGETTREVEGDKTVTKTITKGTIYGSTVRYGYSHPWICARLTVGPIMCKRRRVK